MTAPMAAVATGAIYVPLERSTTWVKLITIIVNLGIVAFMTWTLWRSRGGSRLDEDRRDGLCRTK